MRQFFLLLVLALGVGCGGRESPPTDPAPIEPVAAEPVAEPAADLQPQPSAGTADEDAMVRDAVNGLGADLFARLAQEPGNIVFSPASIEAALAMTAAGARGETASEMHRVLHLGDSPDATIDAIGAALRRWGDPANTERTVRIANRLYGEATYPFERAFVDRLGAAYGAPLERVDFRNAFEPARLGINGWVAERTDDRIRDLLPPSSLDDRTRLVLVNAVYLQTRWLEAFERDKTVDAGFTLADGAAVQVPTMHRTGTMSHAQVGGADVIELGYRGGDLAMRFVLPPSDTSPEAWATEAHLSATPEFAERQVALALPKFRVEPGDAVLLKAHLIELGMPLAFDEARADFSGMAPANSGPGLVISDAFHKAFVQVDEEGTEAAAATAVVMRERGLAARPQALEVRFDRPFLFTLVDRETGAVLFLGRVSDPRS